MTRGIGITLAAALLAVAGCADPCADSGTVCTIAGTGQAGQNEAATDPLETLLYGPMDVVTWPGTGGDYFIVDWNNHKIRTVIDGQAGVAIGDQFLGDGDADFQERVPPGVDGTTVALNHPTQAEWNPVTGRLLVPSWHNHRVREWDPTTGNSLVVCADTDTSDGNGANAGFAGDGGPAADALMAFPNSIAIDPDDGSFWLLAAKNKRVRKVAADFSLINTMAGNGDNVHAGDGGPATDASFFFWVDEDGQPEPAGAIEHADGKLYIAETSAHAIRVVDLATGLIDSLDTGDQTTTGPNTCSSTEALCFPHDVEMGPDGRLYVADTQNHVIRAIDLESGTMETIVGVPGTAGDAEEGAQALEATLDRPYGIDFAEDGALLIADTYNHRIRRVTP